ncbi:MAG: hypothetical protein U9M89_01250 [Patescibacteria group bacterium]|nr:hypothetical protein [Patescibacteria group bacterium]
MGKKITDQNEAADRHASKRDKKRQRSFGQDNRTGVRLIAKLGSKKKNVKK